MAPDDAVKPDPAAWLDLAETIARLVYRRLGGAVEFQDLRSEAYLGLVIHCRRFDPTRGATLKTWLSFKLPHHLMDYVREVAPLTRSHVRDIGLGKLPPVHTASIDEPFRNRDGRSTSYAKALGEVDPGFARVDERDHAQRLLRMTGGKRRACLESYFLWERTMKQTGEAVGLCESRVSQIISTELQHIRETAGASA